MNSDDTIDARIERIVAETIERLLAPHLARLAHPEPLVYTVAETADVLRVSPDTVTRLVKRGVLARVPHVDGKTLIPRRCVEQLVSNSEENA